MGRTDKFGLKPVRKDPSYRRLQGNYPAKKYKKGTPTITRLSFEFTGNQTSYIDLARALSILNRKLYRQGCYYYINSVELYDDETSVVDLFTAPDTWVTRAALRRGKALFDEMNEDAIRTAGDLYPMYHDFKVYLNREHAVAGSSKRPSLYDSSGAATVKSGNEWEYSKMVSKEGHDDGNDAADEFTMHILGQHATQVIGGTTQYTSAGLIQSYADTRVRKDNNGTPTTAANLLTDPLLKVMAAGQENQIENVVSNLDTNNDETPYLNSVYLGSAAQDNHHALRLHTIPASGRVAVGAGFCAPAGLVMVVPQTGGGDNNTWRLVFNLAVGTYNGVYAERI